MDLKKIPILKDIDFSNNKTKIKIFALVFGILVLILMYAVPEDKEQTAVGEQTEAEAESVQTFHSSADMEIVAGEDNDKRVLDAGSIQDARDVGRSTISNSFASIYDEGGEYQDDIMSELTEKSTKTEDDMAEEVLGSAPRQTAAPVVVEPVTIVRNTGGGGSGGGGGSRASAKREETPEERVERRKRELMVEMGVLPPEEEKQSGAESGKNAEEEEPVIEVAQVRRSGDISTLSGGATGAGQLSSLKNKDQYVNTDKEHLFKVMFPSSAKITSGQRVPVRLLEDMVVDGVLVPANTYLSSVVTFGDGRLSVSVSSIELNGTVHVLRYEGYDTDGMKGLYCPSSKTEKMAKEAAGQAGRVGRNAVSSSLTGLASQIISAGASVIEKSKGITEISISAGYSFYLREKPRNGKEKE